MLYGKFKAIFSHASARSFATTINSHWQPENLGGVVKQAISDSYAQELSAFAHRVNLLDMRPEVLLQALTHKSFLHGTVPYNERLETLGRSLLQFYATEYVHFRYPKFPASAILDAVESLAGDVTIGQTSRRLGMQTVVRWTSVDGATRPPFCMNQTEDQKNMMEVPPGQTRVLSKAFNSLTGAIYHEHGVVPTKNFVNQFVLYRPLQTDQLVRFADNKKLLSALLRRNQREKPVTRILTETGRLTHSPLFVVGVFSGAEQLGEGRGTSLKLAERMAITDATHRHFGEEANIRLPSEFAAKEAAWVPPTPQDSAPIV